MRLRIATYNIHGGIGADGRRDYRRIGQHLLDLGVDIALLQEVDARQRFDVPEHDPEQLCQRGQFHLVSAPAVVTASGWYGNALLSRFPVLASHAVDVSQAGSEPRNIQLARLDVAGRVLRVVNTHKGLKSRERRLQFASLYEQLQALKREAEPMVLGGDFNEWQFFSRAFKAINEVLTPVRVGASFPSRWPLLKLDRLWLTPGCELRHAGVVRNALTRLHSDHCPVVADLTLCGP